MLITELKPAAEILGLIKGKLLLITCEGCREVYLPLSGINRFKQELKDNPNVNEIIDITTDYLCNQQYTETRINTLWEKEIDSSDNILIFSCGVGLQIVSLFVSKPIIPVSNTIHIDGFSGLVPSDYHCAQCGDCVLNITGGICPITACSKSLLNGPCGGAKDGKCELAKEMFCGWEKIIKRLEAISQTDNIYKTIKLRDYIKVL